MAQDYGLNKKQGKELPLACTLFFFHCLSQVSLDLVSLFHHLCVVFRKQHLRCMQHVKQKKQHALPL